MKTGIIDMIIQEPAQFINEFIESINALIQKKNPMHELSRKQRVFLAFCIMGILITNKPIF
jgi:ABC-type Mn2+/Zn2+ transport system ATPase subunit